MTKTSTLPFLKVFRVLYSYNINKRKSGTGFGIRDLESQMKKKNNSVLLWRDPWSLGKYYWEQGWGSDESARLPPLGPGFDSRSWRHVTCVLSFLKVLALTPSLRGFSSRSSGFRPSTKNLIPNSNRKRWTRRACPFINYKQKKLKKDIYWKEMYRKLPRWRKHANVKLN